MGGRIRLRAEDGHEFDAFRADPIVPRRGAVVVVQEIFGVNAHIRSVCDRFAKANHRLLYCNSCRARFSEFKGTPLFNSKLPHDKVLAVLEHLAEGCGVRQTARLVGVNKDTVTRLALLAGTHAKDTHDEVVAFSPGDPRDPVRREVGVRGQEAEEL